MEALNEVRTHAMAAAAKAVGDDTGFETQDTTRYTSAQMFAKIQ